MRAWLLSGMLALAASDARVTIRMNPLIVQARGSAWITCRALRDERNRGLTVGIAGYRSSYVQLDGEAAAITHQILFEHIPCDSGDAFCDLVDNRAAHAIVRQAFQVVNCGH